MFLERKWERQGSLGTLGSSNQYETFQVFLSGYFRIASYTVFEFQIFWFSFPFNVTF